MFQTAAVSTARRSVHGIVGATNPGCTGTFGIIGRPPSERSTIREQGMTHADQGITLDEKGQDQPADKERARTAHQTSPDGSATREATRDPKQDNASKRPGSEP
jgi:hypothetical protein